MQNNLDLDLKSRATFLAKPSMVEPPILELKSLPSYLHYKFLGYNSNLLIIVITDLLEWYVESLVLVFLRFKRTIGWTIADIVGIPPKIGTDKIFVEFKCVHSIEHQCRLNPPILEVIKKKSSSK